MCFDCILSKVNLTVFENRKLALYISSKTRNVGVLSKCNAISAYLTLKTGVKTCHKQTSQKYRQNGR